jgi:hypothetical protein
MGSYRLRRVLRSTGEQDAISFDSRTIEASDLDAAIRAAGIDTRIHGGRRVESAVLSTLNGEILWTGAGAPLRTSSGSGT